MISVWARRWNGSITISGPFSFLNKLDAESRLATPTEQRMLADYVGWGGLSEFFKEDNPHYTELKNVLSDEEYASARESR